MNKWENVTESLYRLEVPGGWIYRCSTAFGVSICFVPHPPLPIALAQAVTDGLALHKAEGTA
jgi:hypothetical protein